MPPASSAGAADAGDVDLHVPALPTKHIVPQTLVLRMAFSRASEFEEVSSDKSAYSAVRQVLDRRDRVVGAGIDHLIRAELLGAFQTLRADVERDDPAPMALANWVAARPTGPWPKIAIVSRPVFIRRSAPYAVPDPQAIAAPAEKLSSSRSGTIVSAGTAMYFACPPWALLPYTFTGTSWHSCCQPDLQCEHCVQPV